MAQWAVETLLETENLEVKQLTEDKFIIYGDKDRKPLIRISRTVNAAGFHANVERTHVTKNYFLTIDLSRKNPFRHPSILAVKPIV